MVSACVAVIIVSPALTMLIMFPLTVATAKLELVNVNSPKLSETGFTITKEVSEYVFVIDGNERVGSILETTKLEEISVEELKPYLLSWDDNPKEFKKIEKADLQYPILIFVTSNGEFISIIDGHHRAQKAARKGLETIKAKIISINSLPKDIRKVFSHMN